MLGEPRPTVGPRNVAREPRPTVGPPRAAQSTATGGDMTLEALAGQGGRANKPPKERRARSGV